MRKRFRQWFWQKVTAAVIKSAQASQRKEMASNDYAKRA